MRLVSIAMGRPVTLVTVVGVALMLLGQPAPGSDVFTALGSHLTNVGAVLGVLVWVPMFLLSELTDRLGVAFVGGSGIGVALAMTMDRLWRRWIERRRSGRAG